MFGAGRTEIWENGQNLKSCICARETRTTRAENEKKNSWELMKRLWVCFFFQIKDFLSGNLPLFSQVSAKEFRNSQLFCMHLLSHNSCSSVFSAEYSERLSIGNHHVIVFISCPWIAWDCLSSGWLHRPAPYGACVSRPLQNPAGPLLNHSQQAGPSCQFLQKHSTVQGHLEPLRAQVRAAHLKGLCCTPCMNIQAFSSKAIPAFKTYETWLTETPSIFFPLWQPG